MCKIFARSISCSRLEDETNPAKHICAENARLRRQLDEREAEINRVQDELRTVKEANETLKMENSRMKILQDNVRTHGCSKEAKLFCSTCKFGREDT